jgi:hypothetical protein
VTPTEKNERLFFKINTSQYVGGKSGDSKTVDFELICHHEINRSHLYSRTKKLRRGSRLFLSGDLDVANGCLLIEINNLEYILPSDFSLPSDISDAPSPTTTPSKRRMIINELTTTTTTTNSSSSSTSSSSSSTMTTTINAADVTIAETSTPSTRNKRKQAAGKAALTNDVSNDTSQQEK